MTNEHLSAHMLLKTPGIGAEKMQLLFLHFHSYKNAWEANINQLQKAGLPDKLVTSLEKTRKDLSQEKEMRSLEKNGITIILSTDKDFPQTLKESENTTPLLYLRGNRAILNSPSVAIVGSRKFSPYGKQTVSRLSLDLAQAGLNIISGLALGIDALAHRSAIEALAIDINAGKTIAVLGGGLDDATITPRSNLTLVHDILAANGTIISIYPPGTSPNKGTFPARNAIMASLSHAILVIEAAENSGTLITAEYAHKYKKHLYAVPGSIFALESVGTHELIASGKAKIMCQANDILQTLHIDMMKNNKPLEKKIPSDPDHMKIYTTLKENTQGLSIDKIIRLTTLEGSTVSQALVIMEIDGIVMHLGGGLYSLK